MKVRVYFYVKQLHQLELDPADFPDAPQDDPGDFVDWIADAGWRVHDDLIGRTDPVQSWVDTDDEVDVREFEVTS